MKKYLSRYMIILVCIIPFLFSYDSTVITVIELISFLVYCLYNIKNKINIRNYLFYYFLYALFITVGFVLFFSVLNESVNRSLQTLLYILFLVFAIKDDQMQNVKKTYMTVASFSVLFFITQFFLFVVFRKAIMFKIPYLTLKPNLVLAYNYLQSAAWAGLNMARFPGPFSEPAIYAAYVLPLMIFLLFDSNNKNKFKAIVVAGTILFSTSGLGFVMVAICFIIYSFINSKNKLWIPITLVVFLAIIILVYVYVPTVQEMVDNLFVKSGDNVRSKADYRIYRGIATYFKLPVINKIFGVGLYNASVAANLYNLSTNYDDVNSLYEYFNGISQVFLYTGMIGALIFGAFLVKNIKFKGTSTKKALFIAYILLVIGTSTLVDGVGLIYMILLISLNQNEDKKLL